MDAITSLKNDHRSVQRLFRRFESAGDDAFVEKQEILDRIIEELSVHAAIEEQVFYPVIRATVADTDDQVLESLEEHHVVKWTLSELQSMSPEDERFDAKVTVLIESVRHHVEEEEQDLFPTVRHELGRQALNDLGDALDRARRFAPTHPHPKASDTPPANLVAGAAAAVTDRVGDSVSGIAQGGVSAVSDLIAGVLGRKKPKVSATGSSRTRKTAAKVRGATAGAKAGARATTTSARKSSGHTATKAKRAATSATNTARRAGTKTGSTAKRSSAKRPVAKRQGAKVGAGQ